MAKVTRKKTVKRAAPSKRGSRKQKKQGFPYIATVMAVLLTSIIAYFIFAVDKPEVEVKKSPVIINEEKLPEKPQPEWDYVDTLKTKEVVVDIPKEEAPTKPYQMQCGSFRNQGDAESLKAKIAFQGIASQVKKTGDWYRVISGPYYRKRVAEKDRHKLQRASINGCQIWGWR